MRFVEYYNHAVATSSLYFLYKNVAQAKKNLRIKYDYYWIMVFVNL